MRPLIVPSAAFLVLIAFANLVQAQTAVWAAYVQLGQECKQKGNYDRAEKILTLALDEARSVDTKGLLRAQTLETLSDLSVQQGDYAAAEKSALEATELLERLAGADNVIVLSGLSRLAKIALKQNKLDQAEALQKRVGVILTASGEPNKPAMIRYLNNMAWLKLAQKKADEAEKLARQAIGLAEQHGQLSEPIMGECLDTLASVLLSQNRLDQAEALAKGALRLAVSTRGTSHMKTAQFLDTLGDVLQASDQSAEADAQFRSSLAIMAKVASAEHPDYRKTAAKLDQLAQGKTCDKAKPSTGKADSPGAKPNPSTEKQPSHKDKKPNAR